MFFKKKEGKYCDLRLKGGQVPFLNFRYFFLSKTVKEVALWRRYQRNFNTMNFNRMKIFRHLNDQYMGKE